MQEGMKLNFRYLKLFCHDLGFPSLEEEGHVSELER